MELNSRRVLYERNGDQRLPMASTTKILTAITVLDETDDLQSTITVPQEAEGVEGSSVYLKCGETYSIEDLLYGLMLRSGNDAATALALTFGKNIGEFSAKMNKTAQKAGAIHSNFVNPHGLPNANHYTTATDLSLITCYALQNETFTKIVSTKFYEPRRWANKNKLLHLYDGAFGVKTGYTKQAGRCLVSAVKRNGLTLICALLNRPQTYERTIELFDDCFQNYTNVEIIKESDVYDVKHRANAYKAATRETFSYPLREEEREHLEKKIIPSKKRIKNPKKGEIIGQIEIYLLKRLLFSANLYKL
ncbi:MAG: D-alanyl-D-alanine carboxypeptidase [Clostridia bacterium]|nr:D-alanyl-D-alanine carboxypeptidase [Clostridia bacterium]